MNEGREEDGENIYVLKYARAFIYFIFANTCLLFTSNKIENNKNIR
jgi:hypothetical protein